MFNRKKEQEKESNDMMNETSKLRGRSRSKVGSRREDIKNNSSTSTLTLTSKSINNNNDDIFILNGNKKKIFFNKETQKEAQSVKLIKFKPFDSFRNNNNNYNNEDISLDRNELSSMETNKSLSTSELNQVNRDERINNNNNNNQLEKLDIIENIREQSQKQLFDSNQQINKWPINWFNQDMNLIDQGSFINNKTISRIESNNNLNRIETPNSFNDLNEPFQLVWRKLAFEPNLSPYERLLSCSFLERSRTFLAQCCRTRQPDKISHEPNKGSSFRARAGGGIESNLAESNEERNAIGRANSRLIFDNLNGHINSDELTAILGPSGSGKTSLLNAICGRTESYRGLIELRGIESSKRRLRLSIIPQKDYLIENLTVWENLLYSSKILNSDSNFKHEPNIMRVVKMLKLTNCLDSSAANISGGEYKRVSIAQELLRQPDILVLDEPTSGLDSLNCKNLIRSLNQLTEASRKGLIRPIAIVMTIHQPDVEIFHMFDHVYCMARRGRVIFDGRPSEAYNFIQNSVGHLLSAPMVLQNNPQVSGAASGVASTVDSSSGQASKTPSPLSASPLPVTSLNPANLLIEIASEDIYGREPIELLSKLQLEQFEFAYSEATVNNEQVVKMKNPKETTNPIANKVDYQLNMNLALGTRGSPKSKSLISFQQHIQPPPMANKRNNNIERSYNNNLENKAETQLVRDKQLNTSKSNDNNGKFWYHTSLLTQRAFKSTIRDPLMTLISFIFHLSIPFVMWIVYSRETGSVKACPLIQREMEMLSLAQNTTIELVAKQQDHLITALECSTMFFLSTYSFSMCSLSVAALAFPLSMHVLLKETRNGWYGLPAFVVAKTLASFLFEVLFPVASLVMIYLMLGMPNSLYYWRLWAIAAVMALISMISHTQGLIFGALCMDSVQTAIFLASALTLPQTVLSGFTARIKHMPVFLQKLSWLSQYRYSSDSINMIRFGFGLCECDQDTDEYLKNKEPTFVDVPHRAQALFLHYANISRDEPEYSERIPGISYDLTLNSTERRNIIERVDSGELDLFKQMAEITVRSLSYGRPINNCESVRSQLLTTVGAPEDNFLPYLFAGMLGLLIATRIILFIVVRFKLSSRI